MKKLIILGIVLTSSLFLSGCSKVEHKSNDEIIKEIKKCSEAGMKYYQSYDGTITCNNYPPTEEEVCIEKGGVPVLSIWDNRLKDCLFK